MAFEMSEEMDEVTLTPGNLQIVCANQAPPTVGSVTLEAARSVVVELVAPVADVDCCTFAFAGMQSVAGGIVEGTFDVIALRGDINFSGDVTGADAALIKPHFGEIAGIDLAGPQFDYNRSGDVSGGDFLLIKPLFGNIAPACP